VLEIAARRAVGAWAEAIDGDDGSLRRIASPAAADELLHAGDASGHTRLVVRGLEIERIRIARLDAAAQPPTMAIELRLRGVRYIEDRETTALVAGSRSQTRRFTERWTLSLDGDQAQPWRITNAAASLAPR
jgi:predicted lipid-binding transport protein (Tim44 family)